MPLPIDIPFFNNDHEAARRNPVLASSVGLLLVALSSTQIIPGSGLNYYNLFFALVHALGIFNIATGAMHGIENLVNHQQFRAPQGPGL